MTDETCSCCGKRLSRAQALYLEGEHAAYCLDCLLSLTCEDGEARRASVSPDLLRRLRDGIL